VAWGIQSGGVSSSIGFNLSLYLESRATPGISASIIIILPAFEFLLSLTGAKNVVVFYVIACL
jgi:hypothetical protein